MKKFVSLFLTLALISVLFVTASADDTGADVYNKRYTVTDASGNDVVRFTYDAENGAATITDLHVFNDNTDVVFPAEIDGCPVKTVSKIYFTSNIRDKIKSMTFEDGIEKSTIAALTSRTISPRFGCRVH